MEGNSQAITFALPIQLLDFSSRVRLRVRTPPFHGGDTGSNPVRGTRRNTYIGIHRNRFSSVPIFFDTKPIDSSFLLHHYIFLLASSSMYRKVERTGFEPSSSRKSFYLSQLHFRIFFSISHSILFY